MNTNEQAPDSCPFCGAVFKGKWVGVGVRWFDCGTMTADDNNRRDQTPVCATAERERLTRERDEARGRVRRLEEAGQLLDDVADAADDDIREHLQVANYNLHGLLNTGERIQPPNPPQTIHQAGIDASVAVREDIRKARNEWRKAKEATP